jgi:excisionase family DNA binding protein
MSDQAAPTLSPKEVALQLGLCTKTVLKLIKEEDIAPVYRMNKRVIRIPQASVDRYLRACAGHSEAAPARAG